MKISYACGLYPEFATLDNVLFRLTPFDDMRQGQRIVERLYELRRDVKAMDRCERIHMLNIDREQVCTAREAFYHPKNDLCPGMPLLEKCRAKTFLLIRQGVWCLSWARESLRRWLIIFRQSKPSEDG